LQNSSGEKPMMSEPRTTKPPADLKDGEWIRLAELGDAQVKFVMPFPEWVFVVAVVAGTEEPLSFQLRAEDWVPLLTDAEIGQVAEMVRRERTALDLEHVADMIRNPGVPLPSKYEGVQVRIRLSSEADVRQAAEALGLEVGQYGGSTVATWPQDRDFGDDHRRVLHFDAWTPPDLSGKTFTRDDVDEASVPVPDHALGIQLNGRNHT
jgi:hypothetical protein